ncbi:MAG: DUF1684 domain-containing protein [Flavobacteriales bacterium]
MKVFALVGGVLMLALTSWSQDHTAAIRHHQDSLNTKFANPETSPLTEEAVKTFEALEFYHIDQAYRVEARFEPYENPETVFFATTTDRQPEYKVYAKLTFTLAGQEHTLNIYQNVRLSQMPQYRDYLFLPFNDLTNGEGSYGGGRYLDLRMPKGNTIVLDFNKCYNPYCAYNHKYSCPIPPDGQYVPVAIEAGVKAPEKH